jgi:hypothetical protein
MEHLIWFGVVLALLLSVMPTTPAPAQYQVHPPAKEYDSLLQNLRSRLCLQPEYESRIMVSRSCNSRATGNDLYQRWYFSTLLTDRYGRVGAYIIG